MLRNCPLPAPHRRHRVWRVVQSALLFGALSGAWPAHAQTPAPGVSPQDVVIRPSGKLRDELTVSQSKTELLKVLERLQTRQEIGGRELDQLRKELQGTPGWAITGNLLAIILEGDLAEAISPLGGHIETHRHNLKRDRTRQQSRLARTQDELRDVSQRIERLADQLFAKRDDAGQELLDEQITDRKALLHQLILRRRDYERYADQYGKNIELNDAELLELLKLEQHVEALSQQRAEYVRRLADAIEHDQDALVTEDVRQSRNALRQFANAMRARPAATHTDVIQSDRPMREGILPSPMSSDSRPLMPETTATLPADAEQLIDDELKKAEARAKPASQP